MADHFLIWIVIRLGQSVLCQRQPSAFGTIVISLSPILFHMCLINFHIWKSDVTLILSKYILLSRAVIYPARALYCRESFSDPLEGMSPGQVFHHTDPIGRS
jgi:hypothetical protein